MGTMTLVVNGEIVAGSVRTPEATYRIRPAGAGLHAVSQVDLSRLPPLAEPIPGREWEEEERPPLGPDGGTPAPVEPRLAPPLPDAFRATEDAPRDDAQGSIATDRAALEALYDATDGPNWTDNTNWKTDAPLGEWFGVSTDTDGRVTDVVLRYNGLAGPIPRVLGTLSRLRSLYLPSNALTGPIPAELGRLTNLTDLQLRFNELTGAIPVELGRLTNLQLLNLINNELTGTIPAELGRMTNLLAISLMGNDLAGPIPVELGALDLIIVVNLANNDLTGGIPDELGNLTNLQQLRLDRNDLTGEIPDELGNLTNLQQMHLEFNWGLSGALPSNLRQSPLEELRLFATQACAAATWRTWLKTIDFLGPLCEDRTDVTIDVAVVYTSGAREAAGGTTALEAVVDLMIAETNGAYEASGVQHRLALVSTSEVAYAETGQCTVDLEHLAHPSDGHMDEVHALRDRVGADMVSLLVGESNFPGLAYLSGAFSLVVVQGAPVWVFAHELGHNMGIQHDRYTQLYSEFTLGRGPVTPDPAYGYVNQRAFEAGAAESSRWHTIMSYPDQCTEAGFHCAELFRFSNPRQSYEGDPLGVPWTADASAGVDGPADAAAVLNATGPAVALLRDRPPGPNRPPTAVGTLPDRRLPDVGGTLDVDVSPAFADPDGDALTYAVSSSAPRVVSVLAAGARVALTALAEGTAMVRVTASDPGGLTATQTFSVTVGGSSAPFTDPEIVPGVTPVRAVHFTELRTRIDGLRSTAGLSGFAWTDAALTAGVTPVRLVHLLELRAAIAAAYTTAGRPAPRWTDAAPVGGTTPIRAAHLMELRAAVLALE